MGEENGKWIITQVIGKTPGRRYGHSFLFWRPNCIIFGGSQNNELVNDIWCLNLEKTPLQWNQFEIAGSKPEARLYHSSSLCTIGAASGMIVIFGGRGKAGKAFNDIWGLRKHRDGTWDWVEAPYKTSAAPLARYQVGSDIIYIYIYIYIAYLSFPWPFTPNYWRSMQRGGRERTNINLRHRDVRMERHSKPIPFQTRIMGNRDPFICIRGFRALKAFPPLCGPKSKGDTYNIQGLPNSQSQTPRAYIPGRLSIWNERGNKGGWGGCKYWGKYS